MRIPTIQLFQRSLRAMQAQTSELEQTQLQISTGLRIMKPSDDPTGAVKVLNLNSNIGMIEQFDRNAAVAEAALGQQESVLGAINDSLQRIRELTVQGMNPTNHDSARVDIALEIEERFNELLTLANTRDANGEFLFAGALGDSIPFVNNNGTVTYQGDQNQREVQIGDGARLVSRDCGDQMFMQIPDGDGKVQIKAAAGNTGSLVVGQYSSNTTFVRDTYTVTFAAGAAGQPMTYTVTDSATPTPNTVGTGTYTAGSSIAFGGVQMALTGTPAAGDRVVVQPSQPQSIFDMVKGIATSLRTPVGNSSNKAAVQNLMAQGLGSLDNALDSINDQRASVGARLSNLESVADINADFRLQLDTLKSDTQDLDYASALTQFNQQLASLQAAQQAYMKTSELSLFRFL